MEEDGSFESMPKKEAVLLRKENFYIYSNQVTIDIFVILIKAYLGKIKKESCLDFDYDNVVDKYIDYFKNINSTT